MKPDPRITTTLLASISLIALTLVVWWPALSTALVFDDIEAVVENPHVRVLWPLERAATAPVGTPGAGRPVVAYSFAVNYALHGLEPWGYHAVSLGLHVLNVLLVFALVRLSIRRSRRDFARPWQPWATWAAWAIAAVWAVHPLQSDAVVYVSQRTELLVSFCLLMTLWAYTCARRARGRRSRLAWAGLSVVACAIGMASKEVMVVAPVLVWLYSWAFMSSSRKVKREPSAGSQRQLPAPLGRGYWLALAGTWLILAALVLTSPRGGSAGLGTEVSPWQYLLTQASVIPHYLRLSFLPTPLIVAYEWPIANSLADALPGGLIVLGLLAAGSWALWARPRLGYVFACFFLILAPSSSVIPIVTEVAAERRMYLPLLAVIIVCFAGTVYVLSLSAKLFQARGRDAEGQGLTVGSNINGKSFAATTLAAACALVLVLATITRARIPDFQTREAIWQSVLEVPNAYHPDYAAAWNNLGSIYLEQGKREQARQAYQKLTAELPDDPRGPHHLGLLAAQDGDHAFALDFYAQALERAPDSPRILNDVGTALVRLGQLDQAMAAWQRALAGDPRNAKAMSNLGLAYLSTGRPSQAIPLLEQAVAIGPADAGARLALAQGLIAQRRLIEASQQLNAAIAMDRANPAGWMLRARLQLDSGNLDQAAADLAQARALGQGRSDLQADITAIEEAIAAARAVK